MGFDQIYIHIISKTILAKLVAKLSLFYLVVLFFISPLYKFLEIYRGFPYFNFAIIRALLAILTFIMLFFFVIKRIKNQNISKAISILAPSIFCLIFVTIIFLISFFNVLDYSINAKEIFFLRIDSCLVGYFMLFIAGVFFDFFDPKKTYKLNLILWILYSLFIFINSQFLISSFYSNDYYSERIINYIFLSNGYLFFSFFVLAAMDSKFKMIIIWLVIIFCMFLIPSRSNTVAFLFATLIPVFFHFWKLRVDHVNSFLFLFLISVIVLFTLSYDFSVIFNNELLQNNRLLNTDLSNDNSINSRNDIAKINFENLKDNWLIGDFMSDVRIFKGDGFETHSYISFWEQFGLIPFLLLIWSVLTLIYFLYKLRSDNSAIFKSTLMLTLFFIPLMVFAKGFTSNLIWFIIPRIVMHYFAEKK